MKRKCDSSSFDIVDEVIDNKADDSTFWWQNDGNYKFCVVKIIYLFTKCTSHDYIP